MRPAGKRVVVSHLVQAHRLSQRRACRLAELNFSTWQYRARRKEQAGLRARIKELAREGFYDGLKFHRVIPGFMAQTGDPRGNGTGGSGENIKAEFNDQKHSRGAVSMARAQSPNSADSQFFIVLADSLFLDGQYTLWGRVTEGMEHVDQIKQGSKSNNGSVADPDHIVSLKVAADVEE